jgi:hypothetical protein
MVRRRERYIKVHVSLVYRPAILTSNILGMINTQGKSGSACKFLDD